MLDETSSSSLTEADSPTRRWRWRNLVIGAVVVLIVLIALSAAVIGTGITLRWDAQPDAAPEPDPAVTCARQTLTEAVVELRLRHNTLEIVNSSDEGDSRRASMTYDGTRDWFALNMDEDGIVYALIESDNARSPPIWLKISDRTPVEAKQCKLGSAAVSLAVSDGSVILIQDSGETVLEAPPAGALSGHISISEDSLEP